MKFNKDGINDAYIENINSALSELKEMKNMKKLYSEMLVLLD